MNIFMWGGECSLVNSVLANLFLPLYLGYTGSYIGEISLLQPGFGLENCMGMYVGVESSSEYNLLFFMCTVFLLTLSMRNCLCTLQDTVCICLKYLDSSAIETSQSGLLLVKQCSLRQKILVPLCGNLKWINWIMFDGGWGGELIYTKIRKQENAEVHPHPQCQIH